VRGTVTIGRLYGIRIGVHASWLAVYAFVTFALASSLSMVPRPEAIALGAVCALALFASVVIHELAHALTARRFGVRTDTITLFLFGGVALLDEEPATPRADALVAAAGPAASAVLGLFGLGVLAALERFAHGPATDAPALFTAYFAVANGVLAVFNLLPAFPMDGGRVLRALLWRRGGDMRRATRLAARVGIGFATAFVAAGIVLVVATRDPLYSWYAVLGGFLLRQSWLQARAASELPAPIALLPDVEVGAAA
jgi:Zn-dependent protease